jgi:hypothetical protein
MTTIDTRVVMVMMMMLLLLLFPKVRILPGFVLVVAYVRHAFLIAINGLPVHSIDDVQQASATVR